MIRNLLSLPTRRLVRSNGCGRSFVRGQNGHERRCGNFHDCHALSDCRPAYVNRLALQGLMAHRDPANRYSKRDAAIALEPLMRLPFFCFNPGPRGLALIRNSRILSKRSGDTANNDRETNRHTESGSHQADTSRRPSVRRRYQRPSCLHWPGGPQLK